MYKTKIVGICNVTPDSFSDGGLYNSTNKAFRRIYEMFEQGADIVDIGAVSTRPGFEPVSTEEEWHRLEPLLRELSERDGYMERLSLDTTNPHVAALFARMGGAIINDVTGFIDPKMIEAALWGRNVECVVSHLPRPGVAESHALEVKVDSIDQVVDDLCTRCATLEKAGIDRSRIIVDPGIGFGKTAALNFRLLTFAEHIPYYRVMIGYSRKRFMGEKRLDPRNNCDLGAIAIHAGTHFLRVHDVAEHVAMRKETQDA
jgi:dihydropteroate synthase